MLPTRSTPSSRPAAAFILLGLVALGTLAAALLHGPALAGLGVVGAFVTPLLVSSEQPDYWALYIYLAIVTAAALRAGAHPAVALACGHDHCVRAALDPARASIAARRRSRPHVFHAIVGFVLAALLVVCGFLFGPADRERPDRAGLVGIARGLPVRGDADRAGERHADTAMIAFALLVAGTLAIAWRAPAATGAVAAAALFVFIVFAEWAVRGNPDMLVLPGGALPGIGPNATDAIGHAASDHRRDLRRWLRRRRLPRAGPLCQRHRAGGVVGCGDRSCRSRY